MLSPFIQAVLQVHVTVSDLLFSAVSIVLTLIPWPRVHLRNLKLIHPSAGNVTGLINLSVLTQVSRSAASNDPNKSMRFD